MAQKKGLKLHEWQRAQRDAGKAVRFGLAYGASHSKLRSMFELGIEAGRAQIKVDLALVELWAATNEEEK